MTKKETSSSSQKSPKKDKLKEALKYLGFFARRIKEATKK